MESGDCGDKFDWDTFLETQSLEPVPNFAFQHVDKCQQSLFEVGMIVEVQTSPRPRFWLANVTLKCGPFLRLRYFGQTLLLSKEIWTDPSQVEVHPVGYSSSRGWQLEPPNGVKHQKLSAAVEALEKENRAEDCQTSLLSPAQQMKPGLTIEVEDLHEPRTVWPATVIRNIGGRLLVKYSIPGDVASVSSTTEDCCSEWIFCLSHRLHWQGWAVQSSWCYKPPNKIRNLSDKWSAMAEAFRSSSAGRSWNFNQQAIKSHNYKAGDRVRVVDPIIPITLRLAHVTEVVDDQRFTVRIDSEDSEVQLLNCVAGSAFPVNSEIKKDTTSDVSESGFAIGMALEAVNPRKPDEICVATVTALECGGGLLRIRLYRSSDDALEEYAVASTSHELFPVGWCDSQGYTLTAPILKKADTDVDTTPSLLDANGQDLQSTAEQEIEQPTPMETEETQAAAAVDNGMAGVSYWCPKIYFNFRCFSGPLLSRIRVAALPRSVGPGPIGLMMKEVLSLLLNGAYKPGSVLKQLQGEPGDPLPPGTQLEPLKAKYRQTTYRGTVPMAATAKDVPEYCRWVCDKLQCCPFLFGPDLVGDPCPHRCCILAKAVWQHKKKAPNWRHRRFIDIIKSFPVEGLGGSLDAVGKSGPASGAMESAEHSDEDSDQQTESQHQQNNELVTDDPSLTTRKRRGRPKKNPMSSAAHQLQSPHRSRIGGSPPTLRMKQIPSLRPLELPREDPPPDKWRAGDVWRFLQSTDCRPLADRLLQQEVDGPSLLLLRPADVFDYITLNSMMAFKLCHLIACLRLTYSNQETCNSYWPNRH